VSLVSLTINGGIATVRMQDDTGRNALNGPFVAQLEAAFADAARHAEVRVVVLCGLPDVFCSGADLSTLGGLLDGDLDPVDLLLPRLILECPVPVIAAMAGHAVGGGLALAAASDIVIAARESRYGASFMNMGFTPGMGTTRLLEHVFTPAVAHELLYTGELRRGAAFTSGFNAVLPRVGVEPHGFDLAARIADKPRSALRLLKRTLSLPRRRLFEEARSLESLMHGVSFHQPGVRARIEDYLHE